MDKQEVIGFIEEIGEESITGWAFRPNDPVPLQLSLLVDRQQKYSFSCDRIRNDVLSHRADVRKDCWHDGLLGFRVAIPMSLQDGCAHEFEILDDLQNPVELYMLGEAKSNGWQFLTPRFRVLGQVEHSEAREPIHGWAIVVDRKLGIKRGRNKIRISSDDLSLEIDACESRPDVAHAMGVEAECGFHFSPSDNENFRNCTKFHFIVVPENVELAHSPVSLKASYEVHPLSDLETNAFGATLSENLRDGDCAAQPMSQNPDIADDERISFTRFPKSDIFNIGGVLAELRAELKEGGTSEIHDISTSICEEEAPVAREFDRIHYLAENPDVAESGIDPFIHFSKTGWREKRCPTPWFNTSYYLESNPDVKDAGINPFHHYIITGRREGRLPERGGGYRRDLIENLVPPQEKTRAYNRPNSIPQLLKPYLENILREKSSQNRGFVLSVSHDCYIRSTGGVQLFLSDEQLGFSLQGLTYLNISPIHPDLVLADKDAPTALHIVLDGVYIGVVSPTDLAEVLARLTPKPEDRRIFVVHCLLGHQPELLLVLYKAFVPRQNFFWVHDFSSLCEGYNLLRNDVAFCHAPHPESSCCRVCIYGETRQRHLDRIRNFFEQIQFVVVSPSRSALAIWRKGTKLPHLKTIVHEHCSLKQTSQRVSLTPRSARGSSSNPVRVAFVGHPVANKGWYAFLALVRRVRGLSCYKFYHFASETSAEAAHGLVTSVITRTSPLERDAMVSALAMNEIDLVLVLAPWPETFSYVTFEALAAGADIITRSDSGNIADVVLTQKRGIVLENDDALFELFESLRAVQYVRQCYKQGINAGTLMHIGTTATIRDELLAEAAE